MDLNEIHARCGEIFKRELLEQPNGRSYACEIWDRMTEGKDNCDNCIGENFNQLIQTFIDEWFDNYKPGEVSKIEFYCITYIFWLYLFLERIEFIFNEIDPKDEFHLIHSFRRGLKKMDELRVWANFFKHPKQFLFVHWPQYIFVGQIFHKDLDTIIINTSFLKEYYSSELQTKPKLLENKKSVVVQFPKLEDLTLGFCKDLKIFFKFVCDNKMISDFLKVKTNIVATGVREDLEQDER